MPRRPRIDLNADRGESFGSWGKRDDAAMLSQVTSANIACRFRVSYVKPHGALYHACATYEPHPRGVATAVAEFSSAVGRSFC